MVLKGEKPPMSLGAGGRPNTNNKPLIISIASALSSQLSVFGLDHSSQITDRSEKATGLFIQLRSVIFPHSCLKAVKGSILVARRAGKNPASKATNKNKVITPA
jgi:hypothetical protein